MEIKMKLLLLGMKQADLIRLLEKKGVSVDAPELSRAISGSPQERYKKIRDAVDEILAEKTKQREEEAEKNGK